MSSPVDHNGGAIQVPDGGSNLYISLSDFPYAQPRKSWCRRHRFPIVVTILTLIILLMAAFGVIYYKTHEDDTAPLRPMYLVYNAVIYTADPADVSFGALTVAQDAAQLASPAALHARTPPPSAAAAKALADPFAPTPLPSDLSPYVFNRTEADRLHVLAHARGEAHTHAHAHGHRDGLGGLLEGTELIEANSLWASSFIHPPRAATNDNDRAAPPLPDAFVVGSDGRFMAVGSAEDLMKTYPKIPRLDLEGATVVPGLGDAHAHLFSLGMTYLEPQFSSAKSIADVVKVLQDFVAEQGLDPAKDPGFFLQGSNWDQNDWTDDDDEAAATDALAGLPAAAAAAMGRSIARGKVGKDHPFPTAADLDAAFPGLPITLDRVDGHALWANTAAMAIVGPIPDKDPPGGQIVRDADGKPTGIFIDSAMALFKNHPYSDTDADMLDEAGDIAFAECARLGLTQVHDASLEEEEFDIMRARLAEGRTRTRDGSGRVRDRMTLRMHGLLDYEGMCATGEGEGAGYECPAGFPVSDLDTEESKKAQLAAAPAGEDIVKGGVILNAVMPSQDKSDLATTSAHTLNEDANAVIRRSNAVSNLANLDLPLILGSANGRLSASGVKLFSDGALGSWGAAMIEPYNDRPDLKGTLIYTPEELSAAVESAVKQGFQVATHAIGDLANRVVINAYAAAIAADEARGGLGRLRRHRVEHLQIVDAEADLPRLAPLQLLASMQPTHATSDMRYAEDRLGPARLGGAYAWASVRQKLSVLPLGTDFPVEPPSTMRTFHAAVTRQNEQNEPAGGWLPEQALTRAQALRGMTWDVAYAAGREAHQGSISVGKVADFVVLSQDIMKVAPEEIMSTYVLATFIDGNAIYVAPNVSTSLHGGRARAAGSLGALARARQEGTALTWAKVDALIATGRLQSAPGSGAAAGGAAVEAAKGAANGEGAGADAGAGDGNGTGAGLSGKDRRLDISHGMPSPREPPCLHHLPARAKQMKRQSRARTIARAQARARAQQKTAGKP